MLNRRMILQALGAGMLTGSLPRVCFANGSSDVKFMLVVLRGAVDGLALAAPYGDGQYQRVRGELAIAPPGSDGGLHKLDGLFGLHPSLRFVHEQFSAGQASVLHAVASPYRKRSHFDGQDMLESGAGRVGALRDGWLNRALEPAPAALSAIALAQNTPLVLRGEHAVSSWAPSRLPDADDSTLSRLASLYADDEFFATRLEQAMRSQEIAGDMGSSGSRGSDARQFADLMQSAGRFLATPQGPSVAVAELGGWDTHANQGADGGALANRFAALDTGLAQLRSELGELWSKTVVAVVTEFGRTVHVNGTRGTDHGTATAALLLGGRVSGGKVVADWPGLSDKQLFDGRDLMPTLDLRSVFKTVLAEHMKLSEADIESAVFPDSGSARVIEGLINA